MASNAQFKKELAASIPVADTSGYVRMFIDLSDGFLKLKDHLGNVYVPLSQLVPFIHNPTIIAPQAPYAAVYQETVKVFPDGGVQTVQLPTAVGYSGRQIKVVSTTDTIGPPTITVLPFGGETINGDSNKTLTTPRERYTFESDGTNWIVVD